MRSPDREVTWILRGASKNVLLAVGCMISVCFSKGTSVDNSTQIGTQSGVLASV